MEKDLEKNEAQRLRGRDWQSIKEAWLLQPPNFPEPGQMPELSSDEILDFVGIEAPTELVRIAAADGVRPAVLSEAICLFLKARHAESAAHRLRDEGLITWSLFNYYHSAYLGAKGIAYLLGITFPSDAKNRQYVLDIFAEPLSHKNGKRIAASNLVDFMAIPIEGRLDQHQLWAWFQRGINSTRSAPWDKGIVGKIERIKPSRTITRPRNSLLYRTNFWIAQDLVALSSVPPEGSEAYEFAPGAEQFFYLLNGHVSELFTSLMNDLSSISPAIARQMNAALPLPNQFGVVDEPFTAS